MGGGESEKEEDWPEPSVATVRLVDAPVLFFVATHKAFRAELASIRRVAAEAAESGGCGRELVVDLRRRLEFLKIVLNYHSNAEDEVIFLAIDTQIKNVVLAYSLEHKSIDDNFSAIFHHLDLLMKKDEEAHQMFQELLFSIGAVQSMICHHMQKEEEQVFPMVMEKFTSEEQCQLVWQYMCSVPVMLLEDFFPWTAHHLSSHDRLDLAHCIQLIMPKEILLQEVVISWIQCNERYSDAHHMYGQGYQLLNGLSNLQDIHSVCPIQFPCEQEQQVQKEVRIMDVYLWHAAIRRDFDQIIEELYQMRSSSCFSSLSSTLVQIKFTADVLIFYSNYLNNILYPLLNLLSKDSPFPCHPLIEECHIKGLQRLLFCEYQSSAQQQSFVQILYEDLKSLISQLHKNLVFLETEVFPSIYESCTTEMQLWLLYTSLRMMPLGLLRCTMTWFSAQLTENQSESILKNLKLGCPSISNYFTSLLHEWVRVDCSGKTSVEKFRRNLEEMFNGRSFYIADRNMPNSTFSCQIHEPNTATKAKEPVAMPSSSVFITTEEHGISYPSGMNLHIFFSQMYRRMPPLQKSMAESDHTTVVNLESRPMDIIFYFHRAIIKDMEYLVCLSANLASNVGFLAEFEKCFRLLHIIYQIHSNSEDEIAFPALESKGVFQNISHSYCIDHKLETKHFRIISIILNEISKLHDHERGEETRQKHYRLCLELHDACLSMHKVLSDHIYREEVDIFPLFRGCFSTEEEEKIVGHMLGRTKAENLQEMIPWLMAYLTPDEQHAVISLWLKVARHTKFDEWLQEWWEGMPRYKISMPVEGSKPSSLLDADPLEVVSTYLLKVGSLAQTVGFDRRIQKDFTLDDLDHSGFCNADAPRSEDGYQTQDLSQYQNEVDKKRSNETSERYNDGNGTEQHEEECQKLIHWEHPLGINQEELEATIRRVSHDSSLDGERKSYIIQNLLMSRWTMKQKMSSQETSLKHEGDVPGQSPSYQDPLELTFGCEHYKRNCKLLIPCCKKLYTCIRCHDDLTDHSADRKTITQMMCMQCLVIQPIGPICSNETCSGFSMGRYYCKICKLFDNDRQIYHCPYCNLCRVGKGLGIDYFHCMTCNACMSRSLFVHACREKCLEDNCPICHEYIFTSNSPVKALPCGHLMHSSCFQEYTVSHYICPICCKTLGDMQVYFGMLDALLAEEKIPEEYSEQIQSILCNDCEKKGAARFHWLYHKCPYCGSYNTRLL